MVEKKGAGNTLVLKCVNSDCSYKFGSNKPDSEAAAPEKTNKENTLTIH
jgi:coenzyme F420-reducing hydrogenase delta subunit